MIEIDLPKIQQSQQDVDVIDILWRQDIDLGACREVFDLSHRQKEHELQRQRELEEEKSRQQLREQEKALLAQLQLDEETGEFVPRPPASAPEAQPAAMPPAATQNVTFSEGEGDGLSFDECMQLLAETFPLVGSAETETPSLDPPIQPLTSSRPAMMDPHEPPLMETDFIPTSDPSQGASHDLEQAWMELLSIPELQKCMNLQMEDMLEPANLTATGSLTEQQEANYIFYMPNHTDMGGDTTDTEYLNTFEGPVTNAQSPDYHVQRTLTVPDISAALSGDSFCDLFYPEIITTKQDSTAPATQPISSGDAGHPLAELSKDTPLKPMGISRFALEEGFESVKAEVMGEFPHSDSGLSLDSSSEPSSPEKPMHVDESFGNSDSEMEEMGNNPVGAESNCTETCASFHQADNYQAPSSVPSPQTTSQDSKSRNPKTDPAEYSHHRKPPFTKDKAKRSANSRSSRDEQQARALQIPFTVDMIVNLPVDDFNEMMSQQSLSEPQLALVRDIRRRGKNKVAAHNCRKRKMENIVGLEAELESLREERERLLRERRETGTSLQEMKKQLSSLYLEVFGLLQNEEGQPYSPSEYSLKLSADGSVFLIPRTKKTLSKCE
ncbi:nuclear factor erythroid 2-related factor 2-like [Megalops cyprinoides]|uniref:nuclear factor erythroid 2-related factor 2-like n=1 Tax=Megalops cyprinoides TaxID=118141 RepID=UPI001864EE20|nr:nuclear factor erythroid 2-related factor 2-like [Megalops cyprinoides]